MSLLDLSTIFPKLKGNPYFDHLACPLYNGVAGGMMIWGAFASITLVRRPFGGKEPYPKIVPPVLASLVESILSEMINLIYLGTKKVLAIKRFESISDKINSLSDKIDDLTYQRFKNTAKKNWKKNESNNEKLAAVGGDSAYSELFRRIFYQELFKSISGFIVFQATNKIMRKMEYSEKFSLISVAGDSIFYQVILEVISLASNTFSTYQTLIKKHGND